MGLQATEGMPPPRRSTLEILNEHQNRICQCEDAIRELGRRVAWIQDCLGDVAIELGLNFRPVPDSETQGDVRSTKLNL